MPVLGAFGLLPYAWGRFVWYLLNFGACLVSTHLLWRYYRGPPQWRSALFPLLFTFWPAVIGVRTGQISALLVLGLAGFLFLVGERRWVAAGACLPLLAIKPQLLHLFWIALALWIVRERRWGVLLGAAGATLSLVTIATAADSGVIGQFLFMAAHEAPQAPASTLGTALRAVVAARTGEEHFWLQFMPPALSLVWFLPYWIRKRGNWDWREQAPIVVVVSLATTAYGWIYDDVVLLVPIAQIAVAAAAARPRSAFRGAIAGYVALNVAILAMNVVGTSPFSYVWVPFGFAAWWLAVGRDPKMPAACAGADCR